MSDRATSGGISPKVTGASLGGALATIIWLLLTAFVEPIEEKLSTEAIASLTGATTTVLAFVFGYFFRDPVRDAGLATMK